MKHPEGIIADNLKRIRENRNWSFDKLARQTGVSKSMLRQIETGKSSPTISTIWKIANGLHLSFTSLMSNPPVESAVRSFFSSETLYGEARHYRVYPLVPFDPGQSFEVYFFEMDPGTVFNAEPHHGDVMEYIFLFTGGINVRTGDSDYMISSFHFLEFKADKPHLYTAADGEVSSGLMVLSYNG